ncbi:MAG: lipid-binding SYLF domain-containing protein [Gammaproteobacteria bacterium]|jgi:lipid-binding SYLF domain-containing protein
MKSITTALIVLLTLGSTGCATTGGAAPEDKRESILAMKNEVLNKLYKLKPDVQSQVDSAPGYAVFSNANVNIILASFGGGYGVVKDNKTSQYTYMKMGEVGVGIGLGAKDFRLVFVFHNKASMDRFIESGWAFGVQADAAAKANDQGAAIGGELTVDNMTIYQITETGLALQATIKGTKYWKNESLN